MSKNYYDILGVSKTASQDEIKKAYTKLAHQYHPDKTGGGDDSKMKEINEAYQILKNKDKRTQYDQFGSSFGSGAGGGFSGGGFSGAGDFSDFFRQQSQQGGGAHFDFGNIDLGDIFGDFFGGSQASRGSQEEAPTSKIRVEIDIREAQRGISHKIKIKTECDRCGGNGAEPGTELKKCDVCHGSGYVNQNRRTMFGTFVVQAPCSNCGGEGRIIEKKCKQCKGYGVVEETKILKINLE